MSFNFVPLRLLARDEDDLTIMSAHLQDSLVPRVSLQFNPREARFTLLTNRFCWEYPAIDHEGEPMYHRVHSGLSFSNVQKVHFRGFHHKKGPEILNLLAVQARKNNTIHLLCSEHHEIRLQTTGLHCHLGDIHHPWPSRKKPTHLFEHIEELLRKVL